MPAKRLRRKRDTKIIARLSKVSRTKPIPKGAKIATKGGRQVVRVKHQGRMIDAPVTSDGTRYRVETPEWYVRYKDSEGVWKREKGYTDKQATEKLAEDIRKREADKQVGITDPFADQYKRPLYERIDVIDVGGREHIRRVQGGHLGDWERALSRTKDCHRDVTQKIHRVARMVRVCGFKTIPDIQAFLVGEFLRGLIGQGISSQTHNHYLTDAKQFCRWLVNNRRMPVNPLTHLAKRNVDADRRRERRDLSADEVARLLEAAVRSPETFRRFTGADRFVIYYLALGTGLRASEVASLTPESFHLKEDPPMVVVEAEHSKHRKRDEQPLQPDLVAILEDYLADKPARELLWPGGWNRRAADMLKIDLAAAEIPYVDASGRYADFHAQRHTYITVAGRNLPPQMAQLLARHKDYRTTRGYTHLGVHDTGAAAAQLPPLLPSKKRGAAALRATGTEGKHAKRTEGESQKGVPHGCQENVPDVQSHAQPCTTEEDEETEPAALQLVGRRGDTATCEQKSAARPRGLEPLTSSSVDWCSIQLSYGRQSPLMGGTSVRGSIQLRPDSK